MTLDNHLAKRFRTKRTGEEEESDSEENDDDPQPKAENVKTEIRNNLIQIFQ